MLKHTNTALVLLGTGGHLWFTIPNKFLPIEASNNLIISSLNWLSRIGVAHIDTILLIYAAKWSHLTDIWKMQQAIQRFKAEACKYTFSSYGIAWRFDMYYTHGTRCIYTGLTNAVTFVSTAYRSCDIGLILARSPKITVRITFNDQIHSDMT